MIREMILEDADRVSEIHVFTWRSAYRGIVPDEHLFNKMRVSKRKTYFENAILSNAEQSYVYDDGIVKAILTIGPCRDGDKNNSFELWGIYVDPFMQGQGIGTRLMEFTLKSAAENGYTEICLWVLENNNKAIGFYESFGFRPDGSIKYLDFIDANEIRLTKSL